MTLCIWCWWQGFGSRTLWEEVRGCTVPDTASSCWLCNGLVADLPAFILTQELLHLIFSPSAVKEREGGSSWVGNWQPANLNPPHWYQKYILQK